MEPEGVDGLLRTTATCRKRQERMVINVIGPLSPLSGEHITALPTLLSVVSFMSA